MLRYWKEGLQLTRKQSFAIGVLFLFHFSWAFVFYRFIQSNVVEVMERIPPTELGEARLNLFLNESLLLLLKTELAQPILWLLLVYVGIKVLLTPILHAGLYASLHDESGPRGTVFIGGIRRCGGSFVWLYLLRIAITAIPLYWAIPSVLNTLSTSASLGKVALSLIPWVIGIAAYGGLLKLFFTYILFGLTAEKSLLSNLVFSFRHLPLICGLALSILGVSILLGLLIYSASFYWADLISVILYLAYPLLQIAVKVWSIAVQYRVWNTETH